MPIPSSRACLRLALVLCSLTLVTPRPVSAQAPSGLVAVPHAAAWRALENHRYGDAGRLFEAAAHKTPADASVWFGAGVAALMRGLNTHAAPWFEKALALEPGLTDAAILLGQAHYREGRIDRAIAVYERALRREPGQHELLEALTRWRVEAATDASLGVLNGAHFDVRFHRGDEVLAHRALDVLEAARERLDKALPASALRRVQVVLYTPDQFKAVTSLPPWAAGIYDGRIKAPLGGTAASPEDLWRVLEHELVHAIVAAIAGPTVPAWFNEGLATALEPDGVEWAQEIRAATPSPPLSKLPRGFRTLMLPDARAAYATSTRAVQGLLDQHGAAAVVGLLRSVGRGLPFATAFQEAIGTPLEAFVSELP